MVHKNEVNDHAFGSEQVVDLFIKGTYINNVRCLCFKCQLIELNLKIIAINCNGKERTTCTHMQKVVSASTIVILQVYHFFFRIIHVFQKKKTIDNLSYAICSFIDREIPDLSKLSTGTDVIHFSHNRNVHTFMNYVKQFIFSK